MVAGKIGEIPSHRRIGLAERIGAIDQRDIIEFGAANALGLHDAEQARLMQLALGLRWQPPQFFGPGGALAKPGNERPSAVNHGSMAVHALSGDQADIRLAAFSGHLGFLARRGSAGRTQSIAGCQAIKSRGWYAP